MEMKRGEVQASPLFLLLRVIKICLELEAQTELNPTRTLNAIRRDELGVDDAEGGWVGRVERWIQEINVVEEVEEVGGKFDFYSLRNVCSFPEAHVEVPQTQTWERTIPAIVGVGGQLSLAEIRDRSRRIREIIEPGACACRSAIRSIATGTCSGAADARVNATSTDRTDGDGWQHACGDSEDVAAAEGLAANRNEIGEAATDAQNPRSKPAADNPIHCGMTAAKAVRATEGQVIVE